MPLPKADLLLFNGPVWGGRDVGVHEAVALWQGRVLAIGTASELEPLVGPGTRRIDLRGRSAIPALNDNHLHLLPMGVSLGQVNLRATEVTTLDEMLRRIKERADRSKPGAWVLGRGYDHFELDVKRHPLRSELDAVAPDNPVWIRRTCGHLAVANSAALRAAGVTENTFDPEGGAFERRDGYLTGLVAERAMKIVNDAVPKEPMDALVAGIEAAGRLCLSQGIVSVMDANVGGYWGFDEMVAYRTAQRTGRLPVRTYVCFSGGPSGILEQAHAAGMVTGGGDDWLRFGPVKLFTDGSAGGRTAHMSEPYLGQPDNFGIQCYPQDTLWAYLEDYHRKGYQLAIHAIGDAAIGLTLEGMKRALVADPDPDRRHRVEHCGFFTDAQLADMVAHRIYPVPQPVFMYDFGELYIDAVGEDRCLNAYPMRRWMDAGLNPAASTDAPVCETNPFVNLYAMLTRRTKRGLVMGGQERLTLDEALHCYTVNGAFVSKCEDRKGTLAPGMLADVAVFSRDLFAADPEEIRDGTHCDLTIADGRVVYDRTGEAG